jgi:hypothetical protein
MLCTEEREREGEVDANLEEASVKGPGPPARPPVVARATSGRQGHRGRRARAPGSQCERPWRPRGPGDRPVTDGIGAHHNGAMSCFMGEGASPKR